MRWGRIWGHWFRDPKDQRTRVETRWGAELGDKDYSPGRKEVIKLRGIITPCNTCRRVAKCAMYQSFTRHRMRGGEYAQGTNILHMCDIYLPRNSPGEIPNKTPHNRTSGKEPQ